MRRVSLKLLAEVLMVLMLAYSQLSGQSIYGTIEGTITDPSGAVIPGAKIEVKNQNSGAIRATVTDEQGNYSVVNLDPGAYTVTVSAGNFVTATRKDFPLLAREVPRLDIQLQLASGGVQTVDVSARTVILDTTPTVSDSKSGRDINSLALNFRATNNTSPIVVANLAPGVQSDRSGNISIAGNLPNMTSFSLDGISTQNVRFGGPNRDLFPSVESIAEFKVNSASNNAEFAQVSDITVTTKGGGNQYHGAGFWFHQNAALNAKDPFASTKPPLVANDFGASVSGPASIPGLYNAKDKTFFFFTYEGTRRPQGVPLAQVVPPTPWRSGNMASISTPIINPATGTPFAGNQIPVNPVSAKILDALFASPNDPASTDISTPNFLTNLTGTYTVNTYDVRGDQNLGANHRVFVRFSHKGITNTGVDGDPGYNTKLGAFNNGFTGSNIAGSWNWVLRPTLINEVRGGFTTSEYLQSWPLAKQGAQLVQSFGLTGLPPPPKSGGTPDFIIAGFNETGAAALGSRPRDILNHTYDFSDNLTWSRGSHTMKFGFDYRHISYVDQITFTTGDDFGDYDFGGVTTFTGNAFADFLLGLPDFTDFAANGPDGRPFSKHYGMFAQDDWQVSRNLTVNYGLRYEINPPFDDATHQLGQFDRNFVGPQGVLGRLIVQGQQGLSLVAPSWKQAVESFLLQVPGYDVSNYFVTNGAAGLPIGLRKTDRTNFQPRLGLSWRPFDNDKTVVHASVGFYSVPVLGAVLYSLLGVDTSNFLTFVPTPSAPLLLPNAFGATALAPVCPPACPGYRRANQINLKDPRVTQWNFSVERDLGRQTLLRLNYTGSHTTNLVYSPDLNQLHPNKLGYAALTSTVADRLANLRYPNFREVLTRDNGRLDKYNAFTAEVSRRFAANLNFQGSYTWAKNLSNALGSAPNSLFGQGGAGDNGANATDYFTPVTITAT